MAMPSAFYRRFLVESIHSRSFVCSFTHSTQVGTEKNTYLPGYLGLGMGAGRIDNTMGSMALLDEMTYKGERYLDHVW